jgi:hypothetical protein
MFDNPPTIVEPSELNAAPAYLGRDPKDVCSAVVPSVQVRSATRAKG